MLSQVPSDILAYLDADVERYVKPPAVLNETQQAKLDELIGFNFGDKIAKLVAEQKSQQLK